MKREATLSEVQMLGDMLHDVARQIADLPDTQPAMTDDVTIARAALQLANKLTGGNVGIALVQQRPCATCRFRGDEKKVTDAAFVEHGLGYYACFAVEHAGRGAIDALVDEDVVQAQMTKRAVVVDGSGYAAQLLVRADFGCILHEPIADADTADVKELASQMAKAASQL